jgi:CRP-like cAMP-binding protein/membrane protein YdbS with pleckstrin-like domain
MAVAMVSLERFIKIPLTTKLTTDQVEALLPRVEEVSLTRGDILFRQGTPAPSVYFVEQGKVAEVEYDQAGMETTYRRASEGEYLGRYALVTGQPFRVTAIAEEDTTLLAIPLRHLTPLLFEHEDWRSWFFHTGIASRLRSVPLLIGLSDWDVYRLADAVEVETRAVGDTIFRAGDKADSFYIVDQGQVIETPSPGLQPQHDWPRYYAAGNFFGLFSLERDQRRQATAVARLATRLFRIPGQTMKALLADRAEGLVGDQARVNLRKRLREVDLFTHLPDNHLRLLTGYVSLVHHRPGDIVARQGEPANSLMILDEGEAVVRLQIGRGQPRPVAYFKAYRGSAAPFVRSAGEEGNYFGAHALLAEEMRGATVEVTQPSIWIVLSQEDFGRFLADAGLSPGDLRKYQSLSPQASAIPPTSDDDLPLPFKVRRHWIIPLTRILPLVLFGVLVLVFIVAGAAAGLTSGLQGVLLAVGIVILAILTFFIVYRYADWLNDTYEVTNEAVIHTEKKLFFSEERYEIPLQQIQNVNIFVSILGQQLGYGNVGIDTAAARGQIDFTTIPQPAFVQELIQKASAQARSGLQIQRRESIRQQLEDQLNPERLKPSVPDSVVIQPEVPDEPRPPSRLDRFRSFRGWFPRFEIRENGQVIWRKHWINLVKRTGLQAIFMGLAVYLLLVYALAFVTTTLGPVPVILPPVQWLGFQGWLFLVIAVLGIAAVLWFIYQYVDWRNDIYIVTDNEVIDVERNLAIYPFFFFYTESRRQASLANVQYVDLNIPHPLAMILNYGNVIVQTAGAEGTLDFMFVGNPRRVHDEILRRLGAYQDGQHAREFQERWGDMPQWFETYRDVMNQTG